MFPIYILMIENDSDKSLAESLYTTYKDKMYAIAYKVLRNNADAEDAVSMAFIRIVTNIKKFYDMDCNKTKSLIGIIIKGIAIDIYRRKNKIAFTELDEELENSDTEDPADYAVNQDSYGKLLGLLRLLSEDYSNVILLKAVYGYTDTETASILNITEGNVRVRYHRAKQTLKKQLKTDGEINE